MMEFYRWYLYTQTNAPNLTPHNRAFTADHRVTTADL